MFKNGKNRGLVISSFLAASCSLVILILTIYHNFTVKQMLKEMRNK